MHLTVHYILENKANTQNSIFGVFAGSTVGAFNLGNYACSMSLPHPFTMHFTILEHVSSWLLFLTLCILSWFQYCNSHLGPPMQCPNLFSCHALPFPHHLICKVKKELVGLGKKFWLHNYKNSPLRQLIPLPPLSCTTTALHD